LTTTEDAMEYRIERADDGTAHLMLSTLEMKVAIRATPGEIFSLAATLMRWTLQGDSTEARFTLCDECSSVIKRGV
jgi:hypothetical protein